MSNEQWAILRKRLYNTLPYVPALLVAYGVMSESMAVLWVALVAQLIGPAIGHTAAHYVDVYSARYQDDISDVPSVSRETSPGFSGDGVTVFPCATQHGSAEPHNPRCEGWYFDHR